MSSSSCCSNTSTTTTSTTTITTATSAKVLLPLLLHQVLQYYYLLSYHYNLAYTKPWYPHNIKVPPKAKARTPPKEAKWRRHVQINSCWSQQAPHHLKRLDETAEWRASLWWQPNKQLRGTLPHLPRVGANHPPSFRKYRLGAKQRRWNRPTWF